MTKTKKIEEEKKVANFPSIYVVGYLEKDGQFMPWYNFTQLRYAKKREKIEKESPENIHPERIIIVSYEASK